MTTVITAELDKAIETLPAYKAAILLKVSVGTVKKLAKLRGKEFKKFPRGRPEVTLV